jgi:DNA polymerase III sliding clamp (beta) subunit (PCNA family)
MKFQVAKSDFEFALNTVAGALGSGDTDIQSHFLFRMKPDTTDQLEVLAGSNRIYAQCPVPKAKVTEEGEAFTIEGWRLKGWVGMVSGALDIETLDNAEVQITAGKFTQRFRSLDPKHFQFMDKTFATAELKGKISAERLSSTLRSAKSFASTDDSNKPDVVVVDIRDGLLMATDKSSAVVFSILKNLADVSMRFHVKDVAGVAGFLDGCGEIEILDATRVVFMRRVSDGALYAETRYQVEFPKLNYTEEQDQRTWKVKTSELYAAAQNGYFGASKDDNRLFLYPADNGQLKVAMKSDTNTGVFTPVFVDCVETLNEPNPPDVSASGFPVSYKHMMALLNSFSDDETIELGVNVDPVKRKRYLRVTKKKFVDEKDGTFDKYVFVLAGLVW